MVIIKHSKRRTVSVKINENGEIFVLCPYGFSKNKIKQLLKEKHEWINKILNQINIKQEQYKQYYGYKKIMLLGKTYDVIVNEKQLIIGDYVLQIRKNVGYTIKKFFIDYSKEYIDKILQNLEKQTNISYKNLTIISARKKWGSCDSLKQIRINYKLIMLEPTYINYVCLHEICHIKHMNHSKMFWDMVEKYLPTYKEIRKNMKQYSFCLELF